LIRFLIFFCFLSSSPSPHPQISYFSPLSSLPSHSFFLATSHSFCFFYSHKFRTK
jgi:hypothetical protein